MLAESRAPQCDLRVLFSRLGYSTHGLPTHAARTRSRHCAELMCAFRAGVTHKISCRLSMELIIRITPITSFNLWKQIDAYRNAPVKPLPEVRRSGATPVLSIGSGIPSFFINEFNHLKLSSWPICPPLLRQLESGGLHRTAFCRFRLLISLCTSESRKIYSYHW